MESSALVLLSGGMDSAVLLYYVMNTLEYSRVEVVMFDYGQYHKIELKYAQSLVDRLSIPYKIIKVDLTQFGRNFITAGDKDLTMVVPGRNSIFLSLATAWAETTGLRDIFIGANGEDFSIWPDCREQFVMLMSQAMAMGNEINGIYAPFVNKSKQEIVKIGRILGVPFGQTWSCYHPTTYEGKDEPCGKCHACIGRNAVL